VSLAENAARSLGYGARDACNFYIIVSFLLGLGWQNDPAYLDIEPIVAHVGFDGESALTLALQAAIRKRQQLDASVTAMHDTVLDGLPAVPETVSLRDMWQVYDAVAKQRGLPTDDALACYETYENDYRARLGLPPIQRQHLNAYQRLGYQHMGIPMPTTVDDIRDMNPQQVAELCTHVLLAVCYGRHYLTHPLHRALNRQLAEAATPRERWQRWRSFLQHHKTLLTEA
jgi:hypothetical protein